jgi:hypothetical protein
MQPENVMKSLAATFLIFVTCIVVSGTNALIDRAQSILSASSSDRTEVGATQSGVRNETTLAEFARATQEKLKLTQPSYPVTFDDLRPNDPNYSAAEAVYPFLHRQLLCPECALDPRFSPKNALTRAQAAVVLISVLTEQERASLLTPEQTADALADVPDADAVSVFARPYIATALADGLLVLDAGKMVHPTEPYSRTEMTAAFDTIQRRFPPSAATASLHLASEVGR